MSDHHGEHIPARCTATPWRAASFAARPYRAERILVWHPGDGDRDIRDCDTLRLEDTDCTLGDIAASILVAPESPAPVIRLGEIAVAEVVGSVLLGAETLCFRNLERIVIGGYSDYPRRTRG